MYILLIVDVAVNTICTERVKEFLVMKSWTIGNKDLQEGVEVIT